MRRPDLEHLIRSASNVTNAYELIIIGSQSILGQFPSAPTTLRLSAEADMFVEGDEAASDAIDANIGELSPFHATYGYYAQGVGIDTASLPEGWRSRLVAIQNDNTDLRIGRCLHPSDLAAAKLAAGREKDWAFVSEMLFHKLISAQELHDALSKLPENRVRPERLAFLNTWVTSQHPLHESARKAAQQRYRSLLAQESTDAVSIAMAKAISRLQVPEEVTKFTAADQLHETVAVALVSQGADTRFVASRLKELSPWAIRPLEMEILAAITYAVSRAHRP